MERFQGGLVLKAHRLLYRSALGSRVTKKKKTARRASCSGAALPSSRFVSIFWKMQRFVAVTGTKFGSAGTNDGRDDLR